MHTTIDWIIENQELYSVSPETSVTEAARFMAERRVGAVSVLENDHLVGIISERDLMEVTSELLEAKLAECRDGRGDD